MSTGAALEIDATLSIPRSELAVRATRAGGPGGQHVNTSSTRIELSWNVARSRALTDVQRARLLERLRTRVDAEGTIRVVASAYRSQARNREDAERRLASMVRRALVPPKPRRATRPTKASVEARLRSKQLRSERKRQRRGWEES